jgi:uncharacterized protein
MLIKHRQIGSKGIFYLEEEDKVLAEIVYSEPNKGQMIIEHTEVDEKLEGRGVGLELVRTAVEYARTNNLKVIPLCTFAKKVFERKPEFSDVLLK